MRFAKTFSGGPELIYKYQVDQDFAAAGVPVLESATGESGVDLGTTTGMANAIGVSIDTATKQTAQQTTGTAAELLSVTVNPDAVFWARLSGAAAAGTALPAYACTTASADGLSVITTEFDVNSPDLADGVVWGYSGANVGQYRKITATGANDATVEIPFDNDIAVGDKFLYANRFEADIAGITLCTELTEVSSQVAEATTGAMRVVQMDLRDKGNDGLLKSWFLLLFADHAYSGA